MGAQEIIASINADTLKTDIPVMDIGDTVNVHCRIVEGEKERVQVFTGTLISRKGNGINEMIIVRRIVDGQVRILPDQLAADCEARGRP